MKTRNYDMFLVKFKAKASLRMKRNRYLPKLSVSSRSLYFGDLNPQMDEY